MKTRVFLFINIKFYAKFMVETHNYGGNVGRPRLPRQYFVEGVDIETMQKIGTTLFDELSITTEEKPQLKKIPHGKWVKVYSCSLELCQKLWESRHQNVKMRFFVKIGDSDVLEPWFPKKEEVKIIRPMSPDQVRRAIARVTP